MDSIDSFKVKALEAMRQTVTTLSGEVEKSQAYIARAQGSTQATLAPGAANPLGLEA